MGGDAAELERLVARDPRIPPDRRIRLSQGRLHLWMDSVMLLKEAQKRRRGLCFPELQSWRQETPAIMSNFYRAQQRHHRLAGLHEPDLAKAPEVVVPEEHRAHGQFMPACSEKAREYMTAIWTELQK